MGPGILTTRRRWTDAEIAILRERYANTPTRDLAAELGWSMSSVWAKAEALGLRKSREYMRIHHADQAIKAGAASRFQKGVTPWNKGTHWEAGGRSVETRFKKGQMSGAAQHNYRPIGSLRITKDGVLERKVTDEDRLIDAKTAAQVLTQISAATTEERAWISWGLVDEESGRVVERCYPNGWTEVER